MLFRSLVVRTCVFIWNVTMCKTLLTCVLLASLATVVMVAAAHVTPSEQCAGEAFDDLRERIQVIPCSKTLCRLRKGGNTTVIFKFKPEKEVKSLKNDVYAVIAGVPLPFLGVTGADACPQVTHIDGTPARCPLAAHQEYQYTNVFPIHDLYPSVRLRVHWSLNDGNKKVICFEVPAAIS